MRFNFHTHTMFSDGKNTPEEVVEYAIENGLVSLGFSDHVYTPHDLRYCMQDTAGYVAEIKRLQKKYAGKIQIYLGVEEDVSSLANREDFEYIIGSYHYTYFGEKFYPLDSNYEYYSACAALFDGDELAFAKSYYEKFCEYILTRKPDIIGHFDLVTKFDETKRDRFLHNEKYWALAEHYTLQALKADCIFEVNTGLMARGLRSSPCPHERLLKIIAQNGGRVTLSSDAHQIQNLLARFEEVKALLKSVGFDGVYALYDNTWQKYKL